MTVHPQGTVTFVFTDIVGSTRLWERHPTGMADAMRRHDLLLREIFERFGGYVFKTVGDAFCVAFENPSPALCAAANVQRALGSEDWGEVGALTVRVGIHTGPAESRDGDYFGGTLNRTSRVEAAAHGGQILVSGVTCELLADEPPEEMRFRDLGEHRLRSLERPERLYQVLAQGIASDFPPPTSMAVLPNNLPVQSTSFVGREKDIEMLTSLLAEKTRLLTLTGSGGTGKTRLALEAGASLIQSFHGGVWMVELAVISDASRILQAVTAAVGVREEAGRPLRDTLFDALSGKNMLLILDNCEHLSGAVASLASDLLKTCQDLKILATSRHSLGIAGEVTLPVPPLGVPDFHRGRTTMPHLAASLQPYDAVRLFLQRAAAVQPEFLLTDHNAASVAEICSRLGGIPLAIELAAARLRLLDVRQIAERLGDRFRLLRGGSTDRLPHQQTLQALIDWSHELLSESEKILFRRLGVFVGSRSLEAIEEVCQGDGLETMDILDLLQQLVEKSLVTTETRPGGNARYTMLESVWHYARQKLREANEEDRLRNAHMQYFLDWAERANPAFEGPQQAFWLACFDEELTNLDHAIRWCVRQKLSLEGLRFLAALGRPLEVRGYLSEAREMAHAVLALGGEAPEGLKAQAEACTGRIAWALDREDEARRHFSKAEELGNRAGDLCLAGFCRAFIGFLERGEGNVEAAEARFREGLVHADETGSEKLRALCHSGLGRVAMDRNQLEEARALSEAALAIYRQLGDLWTVGLVLWGVARTAIAQNDLTRADEALCEWAGITKSLGNAWTMPYILETFATAALAGGAAERAARMLGGAEAGRERFGFRLSAAEQAEHDTTLAKVRQVLEPSRLQELWQGGREAPVEILVAEARGRICPKEKSL